MEVNSKPFRCIWCHKTAPDVEFDVSHVLPECAGNLDQQILPIGVVCKPCNQYFGTKIEPMLLDDPIFHTIAVALGIVDPGDMKVFRESLFDEKHPPLETPQLQLNLAVNLKNQEVTVGVTYSIQGRIGRVYTPRDLGFLSRAVHKIGFEALAWAHFVKGIKPDLDLYSQRFKAVRLWAREGQPQASVRPVFRRPSQKLSPQFEFEAWELGNEIGMQFNLFGDWYAVNLTSPQDQVVPDSKSWISGDTRDVWCVADTISLIGKQE